MKNLNKVKKILLLLLLIFISHTVIAADTVVSGNGSVTIGINVPTCSMSASPASIAYGGSSNLTWSSTNATVCYLNGDETSTQKSNSDLTSALTTNTGYSLSCTGPGGSTACSTNVTVGLPPVNGGWSAWSPASCPVACGLGASNQTRTCTNPTPANGGAACSGSATSACGATAPCPVNCVGAWGACSSGSQTYSITTAAANGGTACPYSNGATQSCGTNCVGAWGACSNGSQTYGITTPASGGGLSCSYSNGATQSCGTNCVGAWGACSSGSQTYSVTTPASGGGLSCTYSNGATQSCGTAGVCSATHYTCSTGTSVSNVDGATSWTWNCNGVSGGTNVSCSENKSLPTVTTSAVSAITQTTATGGGNIISNGGSAVTVSGIVWSTSINPTTANSKTTDGPASGSWSTSSMSGLTINTLYHVRAYATNSAGTSYGADVTFTTSNATVSVVATPLLYTKNPSETISFTYTPTTNTGTTECRLLDFAFTQLAPLPVNTYQASSPIAYVSPSSVGSFAYYVQCRNTTFTIASANSAQIIVNVTPVLLAPTVVTNAISGTTQTSATGGGNTTSNGGSVVTVSGLVWGTTANPTTASYLGITYNGWAASGDWTSNMTGLVANTTYHVRAYSTNAIGTSYGADVSFTTTGLTSGTLTATNCEITSGRTCNTTLTWNTINPIGTSAITTEPGNGGGGGGGGGGGEVWLMINRAYAYTDPMFTGTLVSANSSAGYPYSLDGSTSRTFYLYNNAVLLDQKTVSATCPSGKMWNGSSCQVIPTPPFVMISVSAPLNTINKGDFTTLAWSATNATSCVGTNFVTGGAVSDSISISPASDTTYSIVCTSPTLVQASEQVAVHVASPINKVPKYKEN